MRSFAPPPHAVRRAKLDNLVLVPASELPYKAEYQAIANQQPRGTTLIVLPAGDSLPRRTLELVGTRMQAKGKPVRLMQQGAITSNAL